RLGAGPRRAALRHLLAERRAAAVALGQMRGAAGVVAGLVAWIAIASVCNFVLRVSWPAYAAVEKAMTFTLGMLVARLLFGALASIGVAVAWIAKRNRIASASLVVLLLAMFIPAHYMLWGKFPAWYHLVFLASLVLCPLLGTMF